MNSIQESTNELNAAIRYAENAIASAKQTIESMQFRQDMAKKQYTEQTGREQALEAENAKLREDKERLTSLEVQLRDKISELKDKLVEDIPNMPTIPKDVAIAIFREGIKEGVCNVCDEINNTDDIEISETAYAGDFEVSFSRYIDLSENLDTDWMRSKVGDYEEGNAIATLRGLCETKGFECRIHGIDEKKTPKIH